MELRVWGFGLSLRLSNAEQLRPPAGADDHRTRQDLVILIGTFGAPRGPLGLREDLWGFVGKSRSQGRHCSGSKILSLRDILDDLADAQRCRYAAQHISQPR